MNADDKIYESFINYMNNGSNPYRGLPFYGRNNDTEYSISRGRFTPGVSIKLLNLKDLSRREEIKASPLNDYLNHIKDMFKPGDRVKAKPIRTSDKPNDYVIGNIVKIKGNPKDDTVRVYVIDHSTSTTYEVYPETMYRIFESDNQYILSFNDFLNL